MKSERVSGNQKQGRVFIVSARISDPLPEAFFVYSQRSKQWLGRSVCLCKQQSKHAVLLTNGRRVYFNKKADQPPPASTPAGHLDLLNREMNGNAPQQQAVSVFVYLYDARKLMASFN